MAEDDPYAAFREESDTMPTNLLTVVRQLVDTQEAAAEKVERLTKELELATDILRNITEREIPGALEGLHGKFDLKDGRVLEVAQKIRASIAGEKKEPAVKWLDDHNHSGIVKRTVTVEFKKDDKDTRDLFMDALSTFMLENKKLPVTEDYTVHWMTLEAWVREQLGEGVELPKEIFGIYTQYISKVSGEKKSG